MVVFFRLEPIFNATPAASKNNTWLISGRILLEKKQLAFLIYIRDTLWSHTSYCVYTFQFITLYT